MCPMAGAISESDVEAMKETLQAQQSLLQKLYAELDKEREASSTAASEALSMILRLQGEKAAVKMEACQYKRVAEEKICHAEGSLEAFEDLMYQKEMEIASLELQVQAYKCKFLSLGLGNSGLVSEGSSSYWQQIQDLDEQVKEIAHCSSSSSTSISINNTENNKSVSEPDFVFNSDEENHPVVSTIEDIFEVPKLCCLVEEETEKVVVNKLLHKSNLFESKSPISLECNVALVDPSSGPLIDSEAQFRDLRERIERLEELRSGTSREIRSMGEEERESLREILGQLQMIRTEVQSLKGEVQNLKAEIQSLKGKKNAAKDDEQVHCLKEAMLHFWF